MEAHTFNPFQSFRFVSVSPLYIPTSTGEADNIFITRSYDATSHFETVVDEVNNVWKRVTGHELELKPRKEEDQARIGE
jgi:Rab GDP dissociation inhibitor